MKKVKLKARIWLYPGESANWYFITVPKEETRAIDARYKQFKKGWGSLPVSATIGKTSWQTSIFPDGKTQTYLLPVKASIRKAERIFEGDIVNLTLQIHI